MDAKFLDYYAAGARLRDSADFAAVEPPAPADRVAWENPDAALLDAALETGAPVWKALLAAGLVIEALGAPPSVEQLAADLSSIAAATEGAFHGEIDREQLPSALVDGVADCPPGTVAGAAAVAHQAALAGILALEVGAVAIADRCLAEARARLGEAVVRERGPSEVAAALARRSRQRGRPADMTARDARLAEAVEAAQAAGARSLKAALDQVLRASPDLRAEFDGRSYAALKAAARRGRGQKPQ